MKLIITFLALATTAAHADNFFTGQSVSQGEIGFACLDVDTSDSAQAELNALSKASEFCNTFDKQAKQTSDFIYESSACVIEGRGLAAHTVINKSATALFKCQ